MKESEKDKRIYIDFDGAMAYSEVWVNGRYVGGWPYGYTSFRLDLTPYVFFGKDNLIAVRLDTKNWDSRWYPGAGLYRNVWLVKTSQLHVSYNGVFCTTPEIKPEKAILSVKAEVESHIEQPVNVSIKASVYKLNEKGEACSSACCRILQPRCNSDCFRRITFSDLISLLIILLLWNLDDPELYRVAVTVLQGTAII